MLYHGTVSEFDQFTLDPPGRNSPAPSRSLGVFLSNCPRIAAHFTLKDEVLDAGYDSHEGSPSLRNDPWQFDADPFLEGACILHCAVDLTHPVHFSCLEWMTLVEEKGSDELQALRDAWLASGHDGLIVEAWDGQVEHPEHGKPCVEMHGATVVVFDPTRVHIRQRQPAAQAWYSKPRVRP